MTEKTISFEKGILLHKQVEDKIIEMFSDAPFYTPLPGERELCQTFQVSRPTIRKALENLEQNNIITRIQGRGTFYIGNKVPIDYSNAANHGLGLYSILSSAGKYTRSHVLQQDIEPADESVAACLNIRKHDMVFHLKRLRYVNEVLYSLADDYIPLEICPCLMEIDFTSHSLLKTLTENQIIPYSEEKNIEIHKATAQEAAYLNLKEKEPISVIRICTYDEAGKIIQYAVSKSDAYKSRFRILSTI